MSSNSPQTLIVTNINSAYNSSTSATYSNVQINNTLNISYTNISTYGTHANAAIWIKDYTSTEYGDWYKLAVGTHNETTALEFNGNIVIDAGNIIQELEYACNATPLDLSSIIITGNIANPINGDLGYINFTSGNTTPPYPIGSKGVGIRYNTSNTSLEFASTPGTWVSLTSILNFEYFRNLLDVNVSSIQSNQYIKYISSTSKYTGVTLNINDDPTPTLGGNLIMNNYNIINTQGGIIFSPIDNTSQNTNTNYITIQNAAIDADNPDPIITSGNSSSTNVGLQIISKGSGNIDIITPNNGEVTIQSKSISIFGYTNVSTYYTSTAMNDDPTGFNVNNALWQLPLTNDTAIFDFNTSSTPGTYFANIGTGVEGQILNIILNSSRTTNDIIVILNFGTNKLGTGSGLGSQIILNNTGQSANLIYISGGLLTQGIWQLRNTGTYVE